MIVYRVGSATDDALTPRPGKDTMAHEGQTPGLSVENKPSRDQKSQKVDVGLLSPSLAYFPDAPEKVGGSGHGVIAPVNAEGEFDQRLLDDWASFRGTGNRHRFTQMVLNAIVEGNVRGES